jgi:VWFA-related protein
MTVAATMLTPTRPLRRIQWLTVAGTVLPVVLVLAQEPQKPFRAGVDLIAVDVDVVDHDGGPIAGLRRDQFQVSIDGKARKVLSADFVGVTTRVPASAPRTWAEAPMPARPAPTSVAEQGRVYILAFDAMSFPALEIAPAREAAHAFVDRLQPNDLVGLIVFPEGPLLQVTTDRAQFFREIDRIVGVASSTVVNRWALTPSEIVELTYLSQKNDKKALAAEVYKICAGTNDPETCQTGDPPHVVTDATMMAMFEEMEIAQRLGALQAMFKSLASSPQHKVVVLMSAGIIATDRPGGRPDLEDIGRVVGQRAAEANASVYALHFDRLHMDGMSASRSGARQSDLMRDTTILAHSLDQIAGTSGGALFTVTQGGGEFAFNRVLNETSGYYVLGVEPADKDRDGRSHQLQVNVAEKAVTVRGRSWVTLPKAGARAPAPGADAGASASAASVAPAPAAPAAPAPLPDSVRGVAEAYARKDYAAAERLLSQSPDPTMLIRDFRIADPPLPSARRQAHVLGLELALAGLSSANGFARDEGLKLLTLTHVRVEQADGADAFACAWYGVEAAGLEGLWRPDISLPFVERASRRCPTDPRLTLARAVILEQQAGGRPDPLQTREILAAYQSVQKDSEAAREAAIRAAWFSYRHGDLNSALGLLPETTEPASDPNVRYVYDFVRGHLLEAQGQFDSAAAAYRHALEEAPGAQSGRVALMTLRLTRGDAVEAATLAEALQTASQDQTDPWWFYTRGDFRVYPAILSRLREQTP